MIPKFRIFIKIKNAINPVQPVGAINFESETITIEQGLTFPFDKAILMQYTGLKDKNGVEIYEGDILEVEKNEDGTYKGTINGKTFFDRFQGYSSKIKVEGMHDINTLRYWNNRVRIIGNIYENPELLKEQNK